MGKRKSALFVFWLFITLSSGIVLGYYLPYFWGFFVAILICLVLIPFLYNKSLPFFSDTCIILFFLFLGAVWGISFSNQAIEKVLNKENTYRVKVISLPQSQNLRNAFFVRVKGVEGIGVNLKTKAFDYTRQMQYLGSYNVRGKLIRRRGFYCLWVKKGAFLEEVPASLIDKAKKEITCYFLNLFKTHLSKDGYEFMSSVFLGRRELLGQKRRVFVDVGASHLLAISGLHLGVTALVLFFVLRFFNIKFRARLLISMVFLYIYTVVTGPSSSTLRSVIMYSVFVFGFFLQRRVSSLNSLGVAGVISLLISPLSLFEVGFQLSFLSVFAIILGAKLFAARTSSNAIFRYIQQILFCSLVVTVFISPLISYYFGRLYFLNILYNILLIPFFTLILIVNFIFIVFSPFGFISQSLGSVLSLLISAFISFSRFLGGIKGSFISYTFSMKGAVIYYLILASVLVGYARYPAFSRRN
ncbi:MAG: ComEC/Rec2 family competence protein [Candidatus Omnitrophota bacterium]|nr:MAG: ComEC/Rec2 family competence protein [Candidatus Omnitrophota bacterium]